MITAALRWRVSFGIRVLRNDPSTHTSSSVAVINYLLPVVVYRPAYSQSHSPPDATRLRKPHTITQYSALKLGGVHVPRPLRPVVATH